MGAGNWIPGSPNVQFLLWREGSLFHPQKYRTRPWGHKPLAWKQRAKKEWAELSSHSRNSKGDLKGSLRTPAKCVGPAAMFALTPEQWRQPRNSCPHCPCQEAHGYSSFGPWLGKWVGGERPTIQEEDTLRRISLSLLRAGKGECERKKRVQVRSFAVNKSVGAATATLICGRCSEKLSLLLCSVQLRGKCRKRKTLTSHGCCVWGDSMVCRKEFWFGKQGHRLGHS